jgi:hypothetical protein
LKKQEDRQKDQQEIASQGEKNNVKVQHPARTKRILHLEHRSHFVESERIMTDSTLPFLFSVQLALLGIAVRSARRANNLSSAQSKPLYIVIALLALWGPLSASLALGGVYTDPAVLERLPGLWVTMVPVLILMIPWTFSASFRDSINLLIDSVGLHKVMFFEGLRVLAIGGIIKGLRGEFSPEIAFYLGIPDLVFGVLSLWAGYLLYKGTLSTLWVIILNAYGFLIIAPGAQVLMNLGIPGPWHIVHSTPDMVSMFEYPMAIAPTVVVPIFIAINAFVIIYLLTSENRRPATFNPQGGESHES